LRTCPVISRAVFTERAAHLTISSVTASSSGGFFERGHDDNKALNEDGSAFCICYAGKLSPGGFAEGGILGVSLADLPRLRYDGVNSPNRTCSLELSRHDTRNSFVPSIDLIVRPNIKLEAEYTYNYENASGFLELRISIAPISCWREVDFVF